MKIKIVKRYYSHECGDGCCSEYGTEWYVNDKLIHSSPCGDSGWLAILNHLGIDAQLLGQDENGEDIWEL